MSGAQRWGVDQAEAYLSALEANFRTLADNPFLFQAVDDLRPGYRRSVCRRHAVYYRVNDNAVEIMAVIRHQDLSRRP